ncbi:MAG: DNA gyrase inhibitor YacG [Deltaproteobacteria bacterium]|nr:DNA gyrase inhibitor YacG [Deltaproteobacteria bacterium]
MMAKPTCPICRRTVIDLDARPFCSAVCRTIDLARWFDGDYRLSAPATGAEQLEALEREGD